MNLTKQFFKYVSQNIFGLLGTSCYILADTYFISQAAGTDGVTLLNLCLPVYNFIFAIGSMIGLGAATRYAILKAQGDDRCQKYFSNAIFCACALSVPFLLVGIFAPGGLLRLMGGDAGIVALGIPYARIFLMFTPFFMCNYIVSAFVRNDGDPSLAMVATLSGSLFNVVFDYIFMFPMGLGLAGAALATAVAPIISIGICSRHFFKKENTVQFVRQLPSAKLLGQSCQLGISGFVGEMSSGVTTTVFNFLLLGLAGNVAVAAYGVIANFALVATAIFNGVAQGAQPLVSECYGRSNRAGAKKLLLEPLVVELSAEEKTALLSNLELLESAGLEIDDFGGNSVFLRSVPADVEQGSAEDLLVELADKLSKGSRDALSEKTEWVLHSISCRAAIKAGDKTSPQELMALAEKILSGEVPPFCPHGRPCVLKLTRKELEKQFGRIV